jgi:hypothetical protein
MKESLEEVAAKIDSVNLWKEFSVCNWAAKIYGFAKPFFCVVLFAPPADIVKMRLLFVEGWQTFHDFLRLRMDDSFGWYISPMEMKHYEVVYFRDNRQSPKIFKHEPAFVPTVVKDGIEEDVCRKLLWQAFGIMLRLESEGNIGVKYASEKAIFSRVERSEGVWEDSPLEICDPPIHQETVSFPTALLEKAKSLEVDKNFILTADFGFLPNVMTKEPRPRTVYQLCVVDTSTSQKIVRQMSVPAGGTLRGMWESLPARILSIIVELSRIPAEIQMKSKRLYRLMRPIMHQLPIKLTIRDDIE